MKKVLFTFFATFSICINANEVSIEEKQNYVSSVIDKTISESISKRNWKSLLETSLYSLESNFDKKLLPKAKKSAVCFYLTYCTYENMKNKTYISETKDTIRYRKRLENLFDISITPLTFDMGNDHVNAIRNKALFYANLSHLINRSVNFKITHIRMIAQVQAICPIYSLCLAKKCLHHDSHELIDEAIENIYHHKIDTACAAEMVNTLFYNN